MNSENTDRVLDVGQSPDETRDGLPRDNILRKALLWLMFLVALKLVAPFLPVNSRVAAQVLSSVFTLAYAIVLIGFISQTMRLQMTLVRRIGALLVFAMLWYLADTLWKTPLNIQWESGRNPSLGFAFSVQIARLVVDVLLVCAAMLLGSLVAQIFSAPNTLAPFCAFCLLLDVWFVMFNGIAQQIAVNAPAYAAKVSAAVPTVGAATTSRYIPDAVGIGAADYLLWGLVFAVMHRFAMNWRASARWMVLLIGGSLLAVNAGIGMLPGFVSIALSTALPNLSFFKFTREERFALLYAGGFIVLLTIGLHFATPYLVEQMKTVK